MVNVLELKKEIADAIKGVGAHEPCVLPVCVALPLSTLHTMNYLLESILNDNAVIVTRCEDCGHRHRDGTCLIHKRPTCPNEFCNFGVDAECLRWELSHD
jgi:C4-type Zn-finger protein